MKKHIILAAMTIFGAWNANAEVQNTKTMGTNQRYQLIQLSSMRRDQYLLDTATGKMWNPTCVVASKTSDDCAQVAWQPVDVVGLNISQKDVDKKALASGDK